MNLLMLYGNAAASYDDYRVFSDLGFAVASPFKHLGQEWEIDRPVLEEPIFPEIQEALAQVPSRYQPRLPYPQDRGLDVHQAPLALPPEFFEPFDVVVILLVSDWVVRYWPSMTAGRPRLIVWRAGEGMPWQDYNLQSLRGMGLKVVRSSTLELTMKDNIGSDAVIRWATDPTDWYGWDGTKQHVLVVSRCLHRENRQWFEVDQLAHEFPLQLVGPDNKLPYAVGTYSFEQLQQAYRQAAVYFDANAKPAPYTGTFREAWMTGTPVVTVGSKRGRWMELETYEVPSLIDHGVNGFCSDDMDVLRMAVKGLLDDQRLGERVGASGRQKAIEIFGREVVTEQWRRFFENSL